jgi:hypothetical protein
MSPYAPGFVGSDWERGEKADLPREISTDHMNALLLPVTTGSPPARPRSWVGGLLGGSHAKEKYFTSIGRFREAAVDGALPSTAAAASTPWSNSGRGARLTPLDGTLPQGELWPTTFAAQVHEPDYRESWIQGLSVYHNPNATIPLPEATFPGAAHHTSRDDTILAHIPPFFPLGSQDYIVVPTNDV